MIRGTVEADQPQPPPNSAQLIDQMQTQPTPDVKDQKKMGEGYTHTQHVQQHNKLQRHSFLTCAFSGHALTLRPHTVRRARCGRG